MPDRDPSLLRLRDGRTLAYEEHGAEDGVPVLYFSGGGDSRLTRHPDDALASDLGLRVIAVDRPGCGRSDFRASRSVLDWVEDVEQLVDGLGHDRFAVLGWSAGGPFALACARTLRDRVEAAVVVAGMPEPDRIGLLPRDLTTTLRLARRSPRLVHAQLVAWAKRPPPPTGDPDCDEIYASGRIEAFRQGPHGLAWELHLLARPWGFRPEEIRVPVTLWYGERDHVCPPAIGRDLAARIPGATLRVVDDCHQLLFSRWSEILSELRAARRGTRRGPRTSAR